ncbi:MAG: hypothetical protein ABH954_02960 [Candidatus Omnitrophota bacterium]
MKKILINCVVFLGFFSLFLSVSGSGFSETEIIWQKFTDGIREKDINFVLIEANTIYVGTDRAVYLSEDEGRHYKKVLNISGKDSNVNFLIKDQNNPQIIYAATGNGLYQSVNSGKSWKNIFKGRNSLQRNCNAIAINDNRIFLATQEGLFFSFDNAKTWNKSSGDLGSMEITSVALSENNIYLAASQGIYALTLDLKDQNKLYAVSIQEVSEESEENNNDDSDETAGLSRINDIKIDKNKIYFGSDKGLFSSDDFGESWKRFNLEGLLSRDIKTIILDSKTDRIFVGTNRGIFGFSNNKWHQLYKGILTNRINYLTTDSSSNLWAATDKGVFKGSPRSEKFSIKQDEIEDIFVAFEGEPSIQKIQNQAIRYAEVQPEKIAGWRTQAMLAAFMPSISLNYDKNVYGSGSTNTAESDQPKRYGTAMVGPRDWGIGLSWDLSELVWNPDQTSIDSRSKLMVELREDILDEVTRLYFERRRLQTELLISPPEEANDRLDKVLRLDELTASIDALTGGYLTRALDKGIDSASRDRIN